MKVKLTPEMVVAAASHGLRKWLKSRMDGRRQTAGARSTPEFDIYGAIGEAAVAVAVNLPWIPTMDVFKVPDVGPLHVRTTDRANGRLIIRDGDPYGIYVLAVVDDVFEPQVVGWIDRTQTFNDAWFVKLDPNRPPCWAVPQDELWPIEALKNAKTTVP